MKISILLLALLVSSPAYACKDFSGRYTRESDCSETEWVITQKGCESAEIAINEGGIDMSRTMIFDGQFHVVDETERHVYSESYAFDGDVIVTGEKYWWRDGNVSMHAVGKMYFNSAGNLVDAKDFYKEGQFDQHVEFVYYKK